MRAVAVAVSLLARVFHGSMEQWVVLNVGLSLLRSDLARCM